MQTLADYRGKPGVQLITDYEPNIMTVQLCAGMIRSGGPFGGEMIPVVNLDNGEMSFMSETTVVRPALAITVTGRRGPADHGAVPGTATDAYEPPLPSWKVSDDGMWYVRNDGRYRVNRSHVRDAKFPFSIQERSTNGFYLPARGNFMTAQRAMRRACD